MPVGYTTVKQFKGVNLTDDPRYIADDELTWAQNCYPDAMGIVGPRQRQNRIDEPLVPGFPAISPDLDSGLESTLFEFTDENRVQHFVLWDPYQTVFVLLDSNLKVVSGIERPDAAVNPIPRALGYPQRPSSLVYNNELFIFLGHTFPGLILGAKDLARGGSGNPKFRALGTTWTDVSGGTPSILESTSEQIKFAFGEVYRDGLVLGGLNAPYESLLFFTQGVDSGGLPAPAFTTLLSSSKAVAFGFGDGDKLINAKVAPMAGGAIAVEPYITAFKRRSVWMLQGDAPTVSDNGAVVITPVMRGEGLVSSHAVVATPYGLIWCSGRNVWLMAPGQLPQPLGNKIKGYLSTLPQSDNCAWHLTYCNDVLYLNTPSARSSVSGSWQDGQFGAFGAVLVPPTEQWWCDLRRIDEPKWWGPQDVRCAHAVPLTPAQGPQVIGGVTPYSWNGNAGQRTFQMGNSEGASNTPLDPTVHPSMVGGDLGDVGVGDGGDNQGPSTHQILRTREFDFGDPALTKIMEAVEINSKWSPQLSTGQVTSPYLVYPSVDGGVSKLVTGVSGATVPSDPNAAAPSQTGFALDLDKLDADDIPGGSVTLFERFVPLVMFPSGGTRLLLRTFMLEIQSTLDLAIGGTAPQDYIRRKWWIQSLTFRVRPIGRRPGGTLT